MLRESIMASEGLWILYSINNVDEAVLIDHLILGSIVVGTFKCRKSETNSRELDVEIHYSVKLDEETSPSETIVQMYKVR